MEVINRVLTLEEYSVQFVNFLGSFIHVNVYELMSLGQHVNSGLIKGDIPFLEWIFQAVTVLTYMYISRPPQMHRYVYSPHATTSVVQDLPYFMQFHGLK